MSLIPSASQTVAPFFNFALTTNPGLGILAREGAEGGRIRLAFRVVDGDGAPTPGDSGYRDHLFSCTQALPWHWRWACTNSRRMR